MPNINKISQIPEIKIEPQHRYEVQIKDVETGEVVYLNESKAGIICTIEKITHLGIEIEGVHQNVAWGNPYVQWYCFDQLNMWFKKKMPQVMKEAQRLGFLKSFNVDFDELFKEK